MRKGDSETRPLEVREAKPLWPRVLLALLIFSPLLRDFGLILIDWWEPFTGVRPPANYKTPFVDFFTGLYRGGSKSFSRSFGDLVNAIFSTPTLGISILLMIAGGSMLLMMNKRHR
jgi:hypothetical protein